MLLNGLLFIVLIICVITDLKERKIYNKVIFPSLILSFILHAIIGGWSGIWGSLLGFACGLAILLIPYLMGGMGAGDVKLLALIGSLKGVVFVINTALYMAIVGGLIGLIVLLFNKGFFKRLKTFIMSLGGLRYGMNLPPLFDKDGLQKTYPYGVAIAAGAVMAFFLNEVVTK